MSEQLPVGWQEAEIRQVAEVNPPNSSTVTEDSAPVTFVPMASMEALTGRIDLTAKKPFSALRKGFTRFRSGDLLFAKITPCMENGKLAVVRDLPTGIGCGSTEFHVIRPEEGVEADYLRYWMLQSSYRQDAERSMQGAVGQRRVPADYVKTSMLPVGPTQDQKRVVSKIDELFSEIEEGERALEKVRTLVERYRQSVLKAAVTGELTRDWRERNKDKLESGEALLARILKARREDWETAELAKMKAKGRTPKDDSWKAAYKQPARIGQTGLPAVPKVWTWARAEEICAFITKGTTPAASAMSAGKGDVPYIKVYNLTFDGSLNFTKEPTFVSRRTHEEDLARSVVVPGDVLMNIVGPPLGKVSIVPEDYAEWNMNQAIAVFRPIRGWDGLFLAFYLLSKAAQEAYIAKAKATVGQFNLTLEICRDLPIPIPPYEEQKEIVQRMIAEESRLAALQRELSSDSSRSEGLRRSVLKDAFTGKLVPQDPTDEPASVLLERIAAERAAASSNKKKPAGKPLRRHKKAKA